MPAGPVDFRISCGSFLFTYQAFMRKRAMLCIQMRCRMMYLRSRLHSVLLGTLLSYLFWGSLMLVRSGDVELNPGPGPADNADKTTLKQTRLSTRSTDRTADRRESTTARCPTPQNFNFNPTDLMAKLDKMDTSLNDKLDCVKVDVKDIKERFSVIEEEVGKLKEEVRHLREENDEVKECNGVLRGRVEGLERKVEDLEGRSKRNNLLFYGLEREEGETSEKLEFRLKDLFTDRLELSRDVELDRVHRLSSKPNSPIIARCTFYKDKVSILKAKSKLKGTDIFIGEDYTKGVRDIRKCLSTFMLEKRRVGHRVSMVHDHLIIEGKKWYLSADGNSLVDIK